MALEENDADSESGEMADDIDESNYEVGDEGQSCSAPLKENDNVKDDESFVESIEETDIPDENQVVTKDGS